MLNRIIATITGNKPKAETISDKLEQGAIILDVRTEREFNAEHIEGAKHVPMELIEQFAINESNKEQAYVVHCAAGVRAENAVKIMRHYGFTDVTNAGGLVHLQPLVK